MQVFFAFSTHNPQPDAVFVCFLRDHHKTKGLRADVDFAHEFS